MPTDAKNICFLLGYGQYGQIDTDGILRNKENTNKTNGDKKETKRFIISKGDDRNARIGINDRKQAD